MKTKLPYLVLLLVVAIGGAAGYIWVTFFYHGEQSPPVVGLPRDYDPGHSNGPYRGPHPATIQRPHDHFSYPIKPGEIGPSKPLFAGAAQYPFWCRTQESGLGQPVVDNHDGAGVPVFAKDSAGQRTSRIIGYSKDCLAPTRAWYFYRKKGRDEFVRWHPGVRGVAKITVNGRPVDFIVRLELGTINRFIYAIAALKGPDEVLSKPNGRHWNRRLIYYFGGGVGIGFRQGRIVGSDFLERVSDELAKGYAVIHSTANETSKNYDIWLAEDTALRVKSQFIALYGSPLYTVGLGGSGGAIAQYLLAQNRPGLIDAAIPLFSYPDMVTQTIYALDCTLLEHYFDVTARNDPVWRHWENRRWIEGMNARSDAFNKFTWIRALAELVSGHWPDIGSGNSECVRSWLAVTPRVLNPLFIPSYDRYAKNVRRRIHWTYWDDLKDVYGVDDKGYARETWDNVGVQYGLTALRDGKISVQQFLDLNARIGSWKPPEEMQPERYWIVGRSIGAGSSAADFSMWSAQNMMLSPDGGRTPAPRRAGDLEAIRAAYRSGQVFLGRITIPVIDARQYLEPDLNMHHVQASFATRSRILKEQGSAGNQVIWVAASPYNPISRALAAIDQWMLNIRHSQSRSVVANRPAGIADACFDSRGQVIAQGAGVWNGKWNHKPEGACTAVYPMYSTSRIEAGGDPAGDMFKCRLQSVAQAIARGVYTPVDMTPYLKRLNAIFPQGVCDYTQTDAGRPSMTLGRIQTEKRERQNSGQ